MAGVAAAEVGIATALGAVLQPDRLELYSGIGIGVALAMAVMFLDSPPHYIERWRQGAEGEQATAKALRPLVRGGWILLHDVDTGRGNLDHIVVGPPGVFLLESKNLAGTVTVERGVLTVRWREDPNDGYDNAHLAGRMRARAAELSAALRAHGVPGIWVQPVVVLWGAFAQRLIESERVAWVEGRALRSVLEGRPTALTPARITEASIAMARWVESLGENDVAA